MKGLTVYISPQIREIAVRTRCIICVSDVGSDGINDMERGENLNGNDLFD